MNKLEKAWYGKSKWVWGLAVFSALFWLISTLRRYLYKAGFITTHKPQDTVVIIVGNISVGGNGKTPVVVALADYLKSQGWRPGVLSRGYGGEQKDFPYQVNQADSASLVGDEPKLIAQRTGVPVVIDPKRPRGADYLAKECQCNIIICDDGLQHYALARDVEFVVMDDRRYGNGYLLPMGPLREGTWRLNTVDCIIHNVSNYKTAELLGISAFQYPMRLSPGKVINVTDPTQQYTPEAFAAKYPECDAIAGIGNPPRFFAQLEQMGINCKRTITFSDHHDFQAGDIPSGTVIMTQKDAVKMQGIGHEACWYLEVSAALPDTFYHQLEKKLAHLKHTKGTR